MVQIKRILFPVDMSGISPQLVPYVTLMTEKFGAELHLLFVVRILDHLSGYNVSVTSIQNFQNETVKGTEKSLYQFKEKYFNNFPTAKAVLKIGDISEEILNYARNMDIDLLILGTHGRKGLDKVFFGSVAERISKTAPIPVLLVNPFKDK